VTKIPAAMLRRWERYALARDEGKSVEKAALYAHLASSTAWRFERGDPTSGGLEAMAQLGITTVGGNLVDQPLAPEAVAALEDFALFRLRYFGRKSMPWQERAAYEVLRRMETPDREYVVMNEPPGSGKSTLFTHDIPCWLIARDRTIRIMIGSRTERQARMYVGRIKRSLDRDVPMLADADSLSQGIAFDAAATLQDDFGAFKPEGRSDLWRAEALVVRQTDGSASDDKEATVSAWGQDSGFLGGRFDFVIWDDLVDRKNTRTIEARDALRDWWDTEAETRLEPGGLILLQGQRITHDDLYRFCLDRKNLDETPKFAHVVFEAHDTDRCTADHGPDAQPWPSGCLLDPHRLPWKYLETLQHNNPRQFEITYQQKDGDTVGGLVDPAWIVGGTDPNGYPSPGCLDRERTIGEVPENLLHGEGWSMVTVDPSPTEFWGVIWWVIDPETNRRYAIDLMRRRMNPEDFLSLDLDTGEFSGLMVDLRRAAITIGAPITDVIVEVNAAQRWLLSQPHVQRWQRVTGVTFLPHTTHRNKTDPQYGVESIGDYFRQGLIRLPYKTPASRLRSHHLIDEALVYTDGKGGDTTDMVMSTWFMCLGVDNLWRPRTQGAYQMPGDGYYRGATRGLDGFNRRAG
jgi:hypothetical protein